MAGRNLRHRHFGNRLEHAGALHDAGEHAGGKQDAGHGQGGFRMGVDAGALGVHVRVIDAQRRHGAEHEHHHRIDPAGDHHHHHQHGEDQVDPEQPWATQLDVVVAEHPLRHGVDRRAGAQAQAFFFTVAEPPGAGENEDKANDLHRDQRLEQVRHRHMQRRRRAQHGAGPWQEVDPGGQGADAGEDALVDAQPRIQRQHRRHRHQKGDRAGAVQMHQQGQGRGTDDNPRRTRSYRAQDAINDGIQHAGIGHDPEKQDREHKHAHHRGDVLDPGNDEGAGLQAEPTEQRGDDRQGDQGHQRREAFAHDGSEQAQDGNDAQGCEHGLLQSGLGGRLLFSLEYWKRVTLCKFEYSPARVRKNKMKNSIQHIQAFLAVARTGSFTKAASELHLSPSALTVQVQQLEEWLGVALLDRSPRHVSLTAAGQEARGPMEKLLLDLDNIVTGSRDLAALRRGVVTIAALPSVCAGALPPALRLFRERFAGIEVRLQDLVAHRIHAQVRAGDVDFGIGVRARLSHGLEFVPVLNDRLCAFVPLDHPFARHRQLTLAQLADQPIILTGRDSSVREQVDGLFDQTRLTMNAGMEANYMSTVLALVRQGLGISVLPESAADSLEGLQRIHIDHPGVNREIGLISRRGMGLSPAAQRCFDWLRDELSDTPLS